MKKENICFEKGLIPAIIQDDKTNKVLMMGFMNEEAYIKSICEKKVTFYSRSKKRLWTKGEKSKNYLFIKDILIDCDQDSLLIKVNPKGPTCHTNADTCWKEINNNNFLFVLEDLISERLFNEKNKNSYIYKLKKKGLDKISQKLGEEAVELVIESKNNNKILFLNESADLLFHYIILLHYKKFKLQDVISILENRHLKK